jgi:asparagine synthase (glutamine-hydrolysing)
MPGIVGLITQMPRAMAEPQLLAMVQSLRHESFYRTGTWIDEANGIYAGWVAREDSFSDGMPVRNERGDVVLVFSGEDYPEPGTARRLQEKGHVLEAEKGPSYLVHLYEDDPSFPAGLNGRFHGLLADQTQGTAILFNDRYGMQRVNFHEAKEAFYFAAEAKAILAVRPELRTVDPQSLGQFVACGCVLGNRTLFPGIHLLPGGSKWRFRKGALEEKTCYFHPREWENAALLEPEPYYRELREVFTRNLPRYFNGREPIGMSLTGGFDTRVIMAWHKAAPASLPCYTFGGMYRDCEDVLKARKVAKLCGQPHQVIETGAEFLAHFSRYAERSIFLSDGCVDLSRTPDLYVSEKARAIAPVKMVGTYGSEIIRQAVMFKPVLPRPGLFRPEFLSYVQQAWPVYNELRQEHPVTFAAFRQSPWQHFGVLALEQTQLTVRSPYLDNDFVRTVFRAPKAGVTNGDVRRRLIADGNPALGRLLTDRGVGSGLLALTYGNFLEFMFKAEYAYDYGMPQWLARMDHLFSAAHLERLFLGRHKLFHFRVWYRDVLAEYVRQMLLDPLTLSRPYLEPRGVEALVHGHLKGDRNYTNEIHKVLTLELIHRLFVDPSFVDPISVDPR